MAVNSEWEYQILDIKCKYILSDRSAMQLVNRDTYM